jgi:hypothetical protein
MTMTNRKTDFHQGCFNCSFLILNKIPALDKGGVNQL